MSPASYALAGLARELRLSPKARRFAERRLLYPDETPTEAAKRAGFSRGKSVAWLERNSAIAKYRAALAHVAAGRSLASWDDPSRIQETLGDAAELMAILWRRARFKVGDYMRPDGTPDIEAIRAAPAGTFAGLEVFETETTLKGGGTVVNRRWRVPPVSPGEAQALLAKVLNLGHVNDPTTAVQVNLVQTVQALGKLSDGALQELQAALSKLPGAPPAPALPALTAPPVAPQVPATATQAAEPEPSMVLVLPEPPEPDSAPSLADA